MFEMFPNKMYSTRCVPLPDDACAEVRELVDHEEKNARKILSLLGYTYALIESKVLIIWVYKSSN